MDATGQWQMLAAELGFEFRHEIRPRVELPSMHKMVADALKKGKLEQAERILETPMMKSLLSKVFIGSAVGIYRGFECAVFRSSIAADTSANPAYFVNLVLMLPTDLGLGLDIKAAGSLFKISRLIFSGQGLRLPHQPKLDSMISVKAKNKSAAEALFTNKRLSEALLTMYGFSNRFTIWDQSIRYDERGQIIEKDRALQIMNLMVDAAEGLSGRSM